MAQGVVWPTVLLRLGSLTRQELLCGPRAMEDTQTAAAAAEPASKPEQAASDASKDPAPSPTSSPSAGAAAEPKKQDYNTTSGVSEAVQQQMDQGVDAAAASAMEYANYLSGQRTEGYGATAFDPTFVYGACLPSCIQGLRTTHSVLVRSWKD